MFHLPANSFQHKKLYNFSEKLLKRWAIKLFGEFGIDAEFEKGMKTGFTSFTRYTFPSRVCTFLAPTFIKYSGDYF